MPTLFRFLAVILIIGGTIYAALYVLSEYYEPVPKQISKPVRDVQVKGQ